MGKRPLSEKIKDAITEIVNVPRSLITSFDASAPLRQSVILTVTKPRSAISAFGEMFQQAFSQKNFEQWIQNLKKTPEYKLMKDSDLYISDPTFPREQVYQ